MMGVCLYYKRVDGDKYPRQYATAINVPKDQCQQNFNPSQNNFLTQEDAVNVKNAITDDTKALYQGAELIAAGTKKVVISKKKQYNMHSESLLLNPADNSPMTKLLNKRKDGCSVFYTFESPCLDTCLDATGSHSILKALENWKEHDGIKAFVFKNFWKFDTNKDLQTKFKQIVAHVPLYRCDTSVNAQATMVSNIIRQSSLIIYFSHLNQFLNLFWVYFLFNCVFNSINLEIHGYT
uniref:Uncharacterized protein n=1 Tax=Sinocyclocheilus grahami TaxID=75366 RepID=A0A672NGT9_SINGR